MLRARSLPNRPVVCPACETADFSVYRRQPAGLGRVSNCCRCQACDETFAFEEDKYGQVVLNKSS